ncbi:MAG: (d)CMP kinase [Solirubrobacteraceae bacterium]
MLVAIDGPAGAGKSTVARALAARLGFTYMDSGAMYRCVALAALERSGHPLSQMTGAPAPAIDLGKLARGLKIELGERVLLDGCDVSEEIRAPAVSETASRVAADGAVREAMVASQREFMQTGDWVAEGRDIGTVVAPDAEVKVFLTASPQERARRRATELAADANVVLVEQALRDARDQNRAHSPLEPAPGAVILDASELSVEQVVEQIAELVRAAG